MATKKTPAAFVKGDKVRFKTSRMAKPMRGITLKVVSDAFGPWLVVAGEDGVERKLRQKLCKAM